MKGTSYCALHLRARAEHMNNTNAHTAIHNPYDIAGVRSSTIIIMMMILIILVDNRANGSSNDIGIHDIRKMCNKYWYS